MDNKIRNNLAFGCIFLIGFLYYTYLYLNDRAYIVAMIPTGFLSIVNLSHAMSLLLKNRKINNSQPKPIGKSMIQEIKKDMKIYFGPFFCENCKSQTTSKSIPSLYSNQLFGNELLGNAKRCKVCGSSIQTIWFRILFFPLFPRGSYRVKHGVDYKQKIPSDPSTILATSHSIYGKRLRILFFPRHIIIIYGIYIIIILIIL